MNLHDAREFIKADTLIRDMTMVLGDVVELIDGDSPVIHDRTCSVWEHARQKLDWAHKWIDRQEQGYGLGNIPVNSLCFFRDGDNWCCVFADFKNLRESPAGFGRTMPDAQADLALKLQHAG
jgi:hypothetical protein